TISKRDWSSDVCSSDLNLSAGVVLCGGGSLIQNVCPLANEVLGMDTKVGKPRGLSGGLTAEVNNPIYATSVGLVMHAIKTGGENENESIIPSSNETSMEKVMERLTERMRSWFKEL